MEQVDIQDNWYHHITRPAESLAFGNGIQGSQ